MSSFDVIEQIRASRPSRARWPARAHPDDRGGRTAGAAARARTAPPAAARARRGAVVRRAGGPHRRRDRARALRWALDRPHRSLSSTPSRRPQSNAYDESKAKAQLAPSTPSGAESGAARSSAPAPTPGRAQRYEAFLRLRVSDADALSDSTQRALRLTRDLGGFVVSLQSNVPEQGHRRRRADGARPARAGAAGDRGLLGARHDPGAAGADRRPPGPGRLPERADRRRTSPRSRASGASSRGRTSRSTPARGSPRGSSRPSASFGSCARAGSRRRRKRPWRR